MYCFMSPAKWCAVHYVVMYEGKIMEDFYCYGCVCGFFKRGAETLGITDFIMPTAAESDH